MIRLVKNFFHFLRAVFALFRFGFPGKNMVVIGVTGTSGKTTTAHIIYSILKSAGYTVSLLSTVEAIINGKPYDTGFHVTTPSPFVLQKFMKDAKKGGSQYFVLEVTSHALDQFRVLGASIDIGVITNIAHEHIDYHGSFNAYRKAKSKILNGVQYAVLNSDDEATGELKKKTKAKVITFGIKNPSDVNEGDSISSRVLPGTYNKYNILAAVAVSKILKIDPHAVVKGIKIFEGIIGRLEKIKTANEYTIFIDFAHKPNALQSVLETVREQAKNKLIVVFGCAGLRDRLKRPIMGSIAGNLADFTILTAEDPRTEDVRQINREIALGLEKSGAKIANRKKSVDFYKKRKGSFYWLIPDRQEAINFAIRSLASQGDSVLITGKGHEKSMCYGKIEYPWNEHEAVAKALYGPVKTS